MSKPRKRKRKTKENEWLLTGFEKEFVAHALHTIDLVNDAHDAFHDFLHNAKKLYPEINIDGVHDELYAFAEKQRAIFDELRRKVDAANEANQVLYQNNFTVKAEDEKPLE